MRKTEPHHSLTDRSKRPVHERRTVCPRADADAVLQSAVTNSGLSEMDAATVENVKWMMTYLNDCKESNVGQLFMAVQNYVWENQSYKGEPGGDGDAGGYHLA